MLIQTETMPNSDNGASRDKACAGHSHSRYRLGYEVVDETMSALVFSIGKREKSLVYNMAKEKK